jgi:hypothetical protein
LNRESTSWYGPQRFQSTLNQGVIEVRSLGCFV